MTQTLRCALVGYGFIAGKGHAPVYAERSVSAKDFEIVAIVDSNEARRAAAKRDFPDARIYSDHTEMLHAEAGRIDFVDITTPPYAHATIAHAALDRGLHVLCEKPIAVSPEEAVSLAEHARAAKRVFFPCHNYKHAPVIKTVRSLLESGSIGRVHLVTLQTFRTTHARGVAEWKPDWRRERRYSGGGIAMDHGSHTLYLAFEWLGSHPISVSAKASNLSEFDTEDNFSATLTFPNGIATAQLTWTAGARKVMYTLHGEYGAITVDDDQVQLLVRDDLVASRPDLTRKAGVQSVPSHWMDASHKEWFGSLLDKFKAAIAANDYVGADARDAIECIKVISAAYLSASLSSREVAIVDARPPTRENGARSNGHHRAAPSPPMSPLGLEEKALIGLFLALPALVLAAYGVRVAVVGRALDPRVQREASTILMGRFPIEAFHWALRGVGKALSRSGISPDALTLISLLISGASLPLAALGLLPAAGAALLFGAAFDAFDGIVARERGVASDSGEVLDAVVDRYADAAPLLGLAVFYRASVPALLLVMAALMGSMLVSYVRAKSEAMSLSLPGGLMRRHERIGYLTVGLLVGPLLRPANSPVAAPLTLLAVGVVAVVANIAAVSLTRAARVALVAQGRGPKGRA